MKIPGPDHPIAIEPANARVIVRFAGQCVADSTRALALKEAALPLVYYFPREDVELSLLERTTHSTHCPYKGDAAYFSLRIAGRQSLDAAWSYETPFPAIARIRNHLAFYPDRVGGIEVQPLS
jgi:uncharacterized protein (DUF427 family)